MKHETLQNKSEYGRTQSEKNHSSHLFLLLIYHDVDALTPTHINA